MNSLASCVRGCDITPVSCLKERQCVKISNILEIAVTTRVSLL